MHDAVAEAPSLLNPKVEWCASHAGATDAQHFMPVIEKPLSGVDAEAAAGTEDCVFHAANAVR
jgi:hypothetical protein